MGNQEVRPHWKLDTPFCSSCHGEIGFMTRHHCRHCGQVFCSHCSSYAFAIPHYYDDKVQRRVCKCCYEQLMKCRIPTGASLSSSVLESDNCKIGFENFKFLTVIGIGKYGKVVKVSEKTTGKIYAMKILSKKNILDNNMVKNTISERNILMKVNHPFLMRLHYAFQTSEKLALVMDFINGGDLFHHLQLLPQRRFDNNRAMFYIAEITLGIEHLHSLGILYRDLKPENVLIDSEGHIRLTDFGLSKEGLFKSNDRTSSFCGTPEYLAPEILKGGNYNNAVDWWALGALMYELLTGWVPFYTKDTQQMYQLKLTARVGFPDYIEPLAKNLLTRLLDRNPDTRLTDPKQIKSHPWFTPIDWDALYNKKVQPPYIPILNSTQSVEMFDTDFTEKNVESEIGNTAEPVIDDTTDQHFPSFTYYESPNVPLPNNVLIESSH